MNAYSTIRNTGYAAVQYCQIKRPWATFPA